MRGGRGGGASVWGGVGGGGGICVGMWRSVCVGVGGCAHVGV